MAPYDTKRPFIHFCQRVRASNAWNTLLSGYQRTTSEGETVGPHGQCQNKLLGEMYQDIVKKIKEKDGKDAQFAWKKYVREMFEDYIAEWEGKSSTAKTLECKYVPPNSGKSKKVKDRMSKTKGTLRFRLKEAKEGKSNALKQAAKNLKAKERCDELKKKLKEQLSTAKKEVEKCKKCSEELKKLQAKMDMRA